ncbi:MAG: thermonuclease family protein [Actinophytocola sp.]|uniref:thermonuclease family protein n=1 Tax=Actinophytocola sp. TaxID=1872138 RepID=UPI003D6B1DB6
MTDLVQIFWTPAGVSMSSNETRQLVDITDGDTPNIRMPVRMLSVDTPEVTARSADGAHRVDEKFAQLAEWIAQGKAPISGPMGEYFRPKLATGRAGSLQFTQGKAASEFAKKNAERRLTKPSGGKRNLFVRMDKANAFDDNGRLLAYVAPNYTAKERETLPLEERSTFNMDMVRTGWATTFIIYPAIPGELDLPLLVEAAESARTGELGIWSDPHTLLAYEYRSLERLFQITEKIVKGEDVNAAERFSWRERYCVDMRSRVLHGPEDYLDVPPGYRLWLWPRDVQAAVASLNLVPAPRLVNGSPDQPSAARASAIS